MSFLATIKTMHNTSYSSITSSWIFSVCRQMKCENPPEIKENRHGERRAENFRCMFVQKFVIYCNYSSNAVNLRRIVSYFRRYG